MSDILSICIVSSNLFWVLIKTRKNEINLWRILLQLWDDYRFDSFVIESRSKVYVTNMKNYKPRKLRDKPRNIKKKRHRRLCKISYYILYKFISIWKSCTVKIAEYESSFTYYNKNRKYHVDFIWFVSSKEKTKLLLVKFFYKNLRRHEFYPNPQILFNFKLFICQFFFQNKLILS